MRCFFYIFILLFIRVSIQSQDPQFTQFYANSLYLNPALAGKDLNPRFHSGYRNQFPSIKNAYVTYNLEYDDFIEKIHGGLGVQFLYDKTGNGILNTANLSVCYSYQVKLSREWSANFSLKAAFVQKSIDWSMAQWGDQIDAGRGFVYSTNQIQGNNISYFDATSGFLIFNSKFFAGAAVHHLTRPEESLFFSGNSSRIPIRTTIHGGYQLKVLKNGLFHKPLYISPNFLFDFQSNFKQLNFGSYFVDGVLAFGCWYRHSGFLDPSGTSFTPQDVLVLMAGVETVKMRIAYSYDINISTLKQGSAGAHEISMTFDLPTKEKKNNKYRVIHCPVF